MIAQIQQTSRVSRTRDTTRPATIKVDAAELGQVKDLSNHAQEALVLMLRNLEPGARLQFLVTSDPRANWNNRALIKEHAIPPLDPGQVQQLALTGKDLKRLGIRAGDSFELRQVDGAGLASDPTPVNLRSGGTLKVFPRMGFDASLGNITVAKSTLVRSVDHTPPVIHDQDMALELVAADGLAVLRGEAAVEHHSTVVLKNLRTQQEYSVTVGEDGSFSLPVGLAVGDYAKIWVKDRNGVMADLGTLQFDPTAHADKPNPGSGHKERSRQRSTSKSAMAVQLESRAAAQHRKPDWMVTKQGQLDLNATFGQLDDQGLLDAARVGEAVATMGSHVTRQQAIDLVIWALETSADAVLGTPDPLSTELTRAAGQHLSLLDDKQLLLHLNIADAKHHVNPMGACLLAEAMRRSGLDVKDVRVLNPETYGLVFTDHGCSPPARTEAPLHTMAEALVFYGQSWLRQMDRGQRADAPVAAAGTSDPSLGAPAGMPLFLEKTWQDHVSTGNRGTVTDSGQGNVTGVNTPPSTPPSTHATPDPVDPSLTVNGLIDCRLSVKDTHPAWKSTDFFPLVSARSGDDPARPLGDPLRNEWAHPDVGGVYGLVDQVRGALGLSTGAWQEVAQPYFGYTVGRPSGLVIMDSTVTPRNYETATAIDVNGDGRFSANLSADEVLSHLQIDPFGDDDTVETDWFGNCNGVAAAQCIMPQPKRSVSIRQLLEKLGVPNAARVAPNGEFRPEQIQMLLARAAENTAKGCVYSGHRYDGEADRVMLKDGSVLEGTLTGMDTRDFRRGRFSYDEDRVVRWGVDKPISLKTADGTVYQLTPQQVAQVSRELNDDSPEEHLRFVLDNLKRGKPFTVDESPGAEVWNTFVNGARVKESSMPPPGVNVQAGLEGHAGRYDPSSGHKLTFVKCQLLKDDNTVATIDMWREWDGNKVVNSGWTQPPTIDFMWALEFGPNGPDWRGTLPDNPLVPMEWVRLLGELSQQPSV